MKVHCWNREDLDFNQLNQYFLCISYTLSKTPEPYYRTRITFIHRHNGNKKLSYCLETARRESPPKIAEMDVEMTI